MFFLSSLFIQHLRVRSVRYSQVVKVVMHLWIRWHSWFFRIKSAGHGYLWGKPKSEHQHLKPTAWQQNKTSLSSLTWLVGKSSLTNYQKLIQKVDVPASHVSVFFRFFSHCLSWGRRLNPHTHTTTCGGFISTHWESNWESSPKVRGEH